jgi:hypothetical protein
MAFATECPQLEEGDVRLLQTESLEAVRSHQQVRRILNN